MLDHLSHSRPRTQAEEEDQGLIRSQRHLEFEIAETRILADLVFSRGHSECGRTEVNRPYGLVREASNWFVKPNVIACYLATYMFS